VLLTRKKNLKKPKGVIRSRKS